MARSSAIRLVPVASLMFLPSCTWNASMPRSNLPEQMRRNAMRSRWFLFMLAWILKIKPLNCSLHGSTSSPLCASLRGSGVGVRRRNSFKNGSTPKFVKAEPKNTGDSSPCCTASRSNSSAAPSSSSMSSASFSWLAAPIRSSRRASPSSASTSSTILTPLARPSLSKASTRLALRS